MDRAAINEGESPMTPMLTTDEAARLLRVHPNTLRRLADQGLVPHIRVGRAYRFDPSLITAQNIRRPEPRKEHIECPSASEDPYGGSTSPHQAADELDSLLRQLTVKPRKSFTIG